MWITIMLHNTRIDSGCILAFRWMVIRKSMSLFIIEKCEDVISVAESCLLAIPEMMIVTTVVLISS